MEVRTRTIKYQLWLLEEEYAMLQKGAFEFHLNCADYLRQLIFAGAITGRHFTMDEEVGKELIAKLNEIGNAVNIVAYSTRPGLIADHPEWEELKKNYFQLLSLLGQLPFLTEETQDEWATMAQYLLTKAMEPYEYENQ